MNCLCLDFLVFAAYFTWWPRQAASSSPPELEARWAECKRKYHNELVFCWADRKKEAEGGCRYDLCTVPACWQMSRIV